MHKLRNSPSWALVLTFALAACSTVDGDDGPLPGGPAGGKGDDPAATSACPIADADPEQILAAIEGGGSCFHAAGIAEACALKSDTDIDFVGAATVVCGSEFETMTADDRAAYDSLFGACARRYENDGPTKSSKTAYCQLEVVRLFHKLYPASKTTDPVIAYTTTCPVDVTDSDAVDTVLASATCHAAANFAEACAPGEPTTDIMLALRASQPCGTSFDALSDEDRMLVMGLGQRCGFPVDIGPSAKNVAAAYCMLQLSVVVGSIAAPI